jgi:protein tyrosine phosphatase (PTP) superfamily phosphohydrolase (DUF442 family)
MTSMRWFQTGVSPRGAPTFRRAIGRHPVVLFVLALAALSQTGCQSCGPCSNFGNRIKGLRERAFRPFQGLGSGCCGGSLGAEPAPMPYAAPAVIAPGIAPGVVGPGTTIQGSSENLPSDGLEAIPRESKPSAVPGPPAGTDSTGSKSSPGKANYEAFRPKYGNGQARSNALARSLDSSPAPTSRSARGSAPPSAGSGLNALDNLPALDLPREETPPAAPAAARNAGPAPAAETLADLAARVAAKPGDVTVAPGIRRFAGVESKLAGGSLPTAEGLDWLAEKGYKTTLDLREDRDISPAFISDVARRGMRYIALPITAKTVDSDHVSRFHFEISLSDGCPLYFCDTDGTRAGVMWYIRRVTVDKVDPQVARRDAEELGLSDNAFWLAANAYLESVKPSAGVVLPAPVPASKTNAPAPVAPPDSNAPSAPSAGPPPGASADSLDPTAWKPLAAIAVTSLGVPLAYLSRTALTGGLLSIARASLPGPGRSPKSLPGRSDG